MINRISTALLLFFGGLFFLSFDVKAQIIQPLTERKNVSLRGLSVVNDQIIWASGNNGQIGLSVDGGNSWSWTKPKNYENRDFRDIEAFSAKFALIMAVDEPAVILETKDGGNSWKPILVDSTKGMFLDAMDFISESHGFVIGDPIEGIPYVTELRFQNGAWQKKESSPHSLFAPREAFFAASGTNIKLIKSNGEVTPILVSGGSRSRLWHWSMKQESRFDSIPLVSGKESSGANSIDVWDNRFAAIVGGDFMEDTLSRGNCVLIDLRDPRSLKVPETPPHGYRSSVVYASADTLVTCGITGVDVSTDKGIHWKIISTASYHVCKKSKNSNSIFFAGAQGKVGRLSWKNTY